MSTAKSLHQIINDTIRNRLSNLHIALPARIEKYDAVKRQAKVKPLLARRLKDNSILDLPVINNVPVVFPGSSEAVISIPIKKGDTVLLIFSERSLDEWLNEGLQVTPEDIRRNDLSDAIALPGLFSFNVDNGADNVNVRIRFKNTDIKITPEGDVKINGGSSGKIAMGNSQEELLDLIDQLLTLLINSTTATSIGAQPLSAVPQITTLQTDLAKIKGVL